MFNSIKKFLLWILTGFLICLVGISNVFADTTVDTSTWLDVTGRQSSVTGMEYSSSITYNNDVTLNAYPVIPGYFVNQTDYNYVQFSFFEHNSSIFNPCNSTSKFTATFRLLFSYSYTVDYVYGVKWANDNCSIVSKNRQTGWIDVSCIASPSSSNYTDILVYYSDGIPQTSNLYITRNIDIACGLNTDAIITNDNANTQAIIDNSQQNTQNIINNQNQNTQDIIDSNKVCYDYDKNSIKLDNQFINTNGDIVSNNNYGITDYLHITNKDTITITNTLTGTSSPSYCFYNSNKSKISCAGVSTLSNNQQLTIPSNASYLRFSINKSYNLPTFKICQSGNQALNDSINGLDSTLNDDDTSGATSEASDFFSSFNTNTFGLTSIITAPLNLIQSVLSTSCTDLELPLPYLDNKKLTLPCMTTIYSTYFGSFFTIYQTITYGIIAYWVCVRIFNMVKDFKNPEHDEIEVVDL